MNKMDLITRHEAIMKIIDLECEVNPSNPIRAKKFLAKLLTENEYLPKGLRGKMTLAELLDASTKIETTEDDITDDFLEGVSCILYILKEQIKNIPSVEIGGES